MMDIVERLRCVVGCDCCARSWGDCLCPEASWPEAATREAAAEIERLRAEVAEAEARGRREGIEVAAQWHDARQLEAERAWPAHHASGFPVGGPPLSPLQAANVASHHERSAAAIRALLEDRADDK